jgi:hypothetical protein
MMEAQLISPNYLRGAASADNLTTAIVSRPEHPLD